MRLAFRVGQRKIRRSAAHWRRLKAKIAVAISDVRTVKVIFLFINGLENEVVKVVQFSCNQHIGKEQRENTTVACGKARLT